MDTENRLTQMVLIIKDGGEITNVRCKEYIRTATEVFIKSGWTHGPNLWMNDNRMLNIYLLSVALNC